MPQNKITTKDLSVVYDRYFEVIYRFFYFKVLSKDVAEDLTSETFLAFGEKCKEQKEIEKSLKSYLFGIARIVFTKYLQRKYQEMAVDFEEMPWLVKDEALMNKIEGGNNDYRLHDEDNQSQKQREKMIISYIDKLPDKQKRVVYMRLIERMSLKEISKKIGKNMNYVKVTQRRGIKKLKLLVASS